MVVMEIMHFSLCKCVYHWRKMLCISGVPMNDRKSMKNCPGGFKVGQISPKRMLICNKLERFMYVNNTN